MANPRKGDSLLADKDGRPLLGAAQTLVADPAAITAVALTDSSGGTASATLAAITGSYVEATIENTVASLAAQINALIVDVTAARVKQLAILDVLEAHGLMKDA